jgi:hypothetical protein
MLHDSGVVVLASPATDHEAVILGHEGWDAEEITRAVRLRAGLTLRLYSHEMLVASLAGRRNVYSGRSSSGLFEFGQGHPGLQFARRGLDFDWPLGKAPHFLRRPRRYLEEPDVGFSGGPTLAHVGRMLRGRGKGYFGESVAVMGSGPFEEQAFREMLTRIGAGIVPLADSPQVVVVGHDDWDDLLLEEAIAAQAGKTIRIYSQEMALSCFIASRELFAVMDEEELLEYARDHSALEYVIDGRAFSWPTTEVHSSYGSRFVAGDDADREDLGLLGALGYRVGYHRGKPMPERRRILDKAFSCEAASAPGLSTAAALSWGRPHTSRRLKRMACTIAWLARSRRIRVDADYSVAVAQWESDLDYLKAKYYRQGHDFDWPSARVY